MSNREEITDAMRDIDALNALCVEAARQHGDDWPAVWRAIQSGLDALDPAVRARLDEALALMLRVQAPTNRLRQ